MAQSGVALVYGAWYLGYGHLLPAAPDNRPECSLRSDRRLRCGGYRGRYTCALPKAVPTLVVLRPRGDALRQRRRDLDVLRGRSGCGVPVSLGRRRTLPSSLPLPRCRADVDDTQPNPGAPVAKRDRPPYSRHRRGHSLLDVPDGTVRDRFQALSPRAPYFDRLPAYGLGAANGFLAAAVRGRKAHAHVLP